MFPYTAQCLDFVLHVMRQPTDAFGKNFPHFLDESGAVETPQVQFLDEVVALVQLRSTVEVPQLQFLFKVVNIPVGAQRQLPMVSLQRPLRSTVAVY